MFNCKRSYTPKPSGYFRIDFPEKKYQIYQGDCPFMFEYPVYGSIKFSTLKKSEPCWMYIDFPQFKGKIYITYKTINSNLFNYTEDIRKIVYKHTIKAEAIDEIPHIDRNKNVFGIVYIIKGNVASSLNFYLTDSIKHFFSGSLYFRHTPNKDSLAPVIQFFQEDINHLIKSFEWTN